ncbi:MAG: nucleotidyltransferase family protein [Gemmatimonadaceae bacterium]
MRDRRSSRRSHDLQVGVGQRHGIRRLSLFGSGVKRTHRADSDVDMLVEFEDGWSRGLIGMARIEAELSSLVRQRAAPSCAAAAWAGRYSVDPWPPA